MTRRTPSANTSGDTGRDMRDGSGGVSNGETVGLSPKFGVTDVVCAEADQRAAAVEAAIKPKANIVNHARCDQGRRRGFGPPCRGVGNRPSIVSMLSWTAAFSIAALSSAAFLGDVTALYTVRSRFIGSESHRV